MILRQVKNEVGATAIEYGLIASLIGVLAVSGMSAVGVNLSNTYCTVSKYLGGSGECSGSTNSNSSGSSSTDSGGSGTASNGSSGNSSGNPITTEGAMDNFKKSLLDNFDDRYLDNSLGGNNSIQSGGVFNNGKGILSIMNDYNKNNPNDPITHVFGLYDSLTHQPITSWQKASQGLENDSYGNRVSPGNNQFTLAVTTQSGRVYTVDGSDKTMTENLLKGS
ncbi:MAG: Flp family type IVb pilin [Acetobacter orientalis]|uniref:Flp family type IVb pilin n=1 Tax=Acetobacter orientalis TaxID=146474 RepID=UPI0039E8EBAB